MTFNYQAGAWQKLRAVVIRNWRRAGSPACPLCCRPISGPPFVDHIQPVVDRPDLALDPANLRVVCGPCNTRRRKWENSKPTGLDGFPVGGEW